MSDPDFNFGQYFPEEEHQLGDFLKRRGEPLHCRFDFRMTSLEEMKKAAVLVEQINTVLQKLAYDDERDPVLRVMLARDAMQQIAFNLRYLRAKKVVKQAPNKNTTRSVSWPVAVGNLDRPWKRPGEQE